ncbi:hypothetical protein [Trinickia acidisoli]|uniref:hypothetical protein n=1 Tax=Trinickia acidisoli TaxID=2767482 RepID=UPI001A8F552A|nr:hypothetical protein [Trinickia acidisoli]
MVCVAVAAGAFTLATYIWRALDAGARAAGATAVAVLEQRLRESRAKLARLPQLREGFRAHSVPPGAAARSIGSGWHAIADLAARSGVTLHMLEPATAPAASRTRAGKPAGQGLRVEGQADFAGLYAFLSGLATLPTLVVPETVDIKRDKGALVLGTTLAVLDVPPVQAVPTIGIDSGARTSAHDATSGKAARLLADPFGRGETDSQAAVSVGRLVGVVRDGRRALALFEAASGLQAIAAAPGQTLGADRIVHIDAAGVTLASRGGTRRVALLEDTR